MSGDYKSCEEKQSKMGGSTTRGGTILATGKAFLIGAIRCQKGVGEKPWR